MFDDEELEELREERESWEGHVKREKVQRSRTSKRVFLGSAAASTAMAAILIALVSSSVLTSALVGINGIGGFNAQIEALNGSSIAIYPAVGPTAACNNDTGVGFNDPGPDQQGKTNAKTLPQLRGEIRNAVVPAGNNFTLVKDVRVPQVFGFDIFRVRVTRSSNTDKIQLGNASLYVTGLRADKLTIQNAQIREFFSDGTTSNPRFYGGGAGTPVLDGISPPGEFAIRNRPGTTAKAKIRGASARAHYIGFDQLSLTNAKITTQYGNASDFTNPSATPAQDTCPAY